jgi:Membrane bound O-acyl transferase family
MARPDPHSYLATLENHQRQFDDLLKAGSIRVPVVPAESLATLILISYFLLPHSSLKFVRRGRYAVFALICWLCWSGITRVRTLSLAYGFAVGLSYAWCILLSATLMIFNDAQRDFKRIERLERPRPLPASVDELKCEGSDDREASGVDANTNPEASGLTRRNLPVSDSSQKQLRIEDSPNSGPLVWQSFPSRFRHRVDWVLDLIISFRGVGWSWQIPSLPPLPSSVVSQLEHNTANDHNRPQAGDSIGDVYKSRPVLLRSALQTATFAYLFIDLLKVTMMNDPYFWGATTSPAPSHLPAFIATSYYLTKTYRLLVSLAGIFTALIGVNSLGPILFVGLLGPDLIGVRGESWMYPSLNGSFSVILDRGLEGWWGKWWHQSFRFAFTSPGRWAVEKLGWEARDKAAKFLGLIIAFALSGSLHACGSYTQSGDTWPMGPFLFFMLQAVGIVVQISAVQVLKSFHFRDKIPLGLRRTSNLLFVLGWLWVTAPLLVDDLAKGGIWLFEPLPFSPLRKLGFGIEGEGWLCWHESPVKWHTGLSWWQSGLTT